MSFLTQISNPILDNDGDPTGVVEHRYKIEESVDTIAANLGVPNLTYFVIRTGADNIPVLHEVTEKSGSRVQRAVIEEVELEADGKSVGKGRNTV